MNALPKEVTEMETKSEKRSCIYKGITYPVFTDMETKKCFIVVDEQRLYIDCNGNVANKQKGTKSVKTAIENFEDMKKVQDYFLDNQMWNYYLLFTLNVNTGRRISDLLAARWCDFFYKNGNIRQSWDVHKENRERGEKKTGKKAEIFINAAVVQAFELFLEKENRIDFEYDYNDHIFKQLHGTHVGKVLSQEAYRKALIKAGECLSYEVRSHSMRRGMGSMMLELHPNDPKAKSILMELYNHSSEKMTNRYIGETDKLKREYLEDMGNKYKKYVMDGEDIPFVVKKPVSVYDNSELRNYMMEAFGKILDNAGETDAVKLLKLYNELLDGLETIAK